MLLVLWGFTPDRALTVAPGFVGFHLIVMPWLYSWLYMALLSFVRLCSYMPAELLFLSPTIFW